MSLSHIIALFRVVRGGDDASDVLEGERGGRGVGAVGVLLLQRRERRVRVGVVGRAKVAPLGQRLVLLGLAQLHGHLVAAATEGLQKAGTVRMGLFK